MNSFFQPELQAGSVHNRHVELDNYSEKDDETTDEEDDNFLSAEEQGSGASGAEKKVSLPTKKKSLFWFLEIDITVIALLIAEALGSLNSMIREGSSESLEVTSVT